MYVCPVPEENEIIEEHKDTKKTVPVLQKLIDISDKELEQALDRSKNDNKSGRDDNEQR